MISLPPNAYNHRTLFSKKHLGNQFRSEKTDFYNRNADFTQSGIYPQQERTENQAVDFFQSVQVVSTGSGGYQVYSKLSENRPQNYRKSPNFLLDDSKIFGHNISNPDLWKLRFNSRTPIQPDRFNSRTPLQQDRFNSRTPLQQDRFNSRTPLQPDRFNSRIPVHPEDESSVYYSHKNSRDEKVWKSSSVKGKKYFSDKTAASSISTEQVFPSKPVSSHQKNMQTCACGKYHCHKFDLESGKRSFSQNLQSSFEQSITHKLNHQLQQELSACNEKHVAICNTFWKPFLAFSEYKHGQKLLQFKDLWPKERTICELLKDGIQNTVLRDSIPDLCLLAVVCGPVDLLKTLLNLSLIRVDYQLDNDASLLHLACLVQNQEMVQYLVQSGVSPNMRDKSGNTADQVCFSTQIRKSLPAKYLHSERRDTRSQFKVIPSLQDKDVILRLTLNHKNFYELHKKLQTFDLNINTECSADGDFLLHSICRGGLCQLIHIYTLVTIHNADIELCNADGMTPLMIVAEAGESILCGILMCVFGANPNKQNIQNGKSALHYAVQNNHIDVVNCLIKRGVDVNQEDYQCCLPDDLPLCTSISEDCREIIKMIRIQRYKQLEQAVLQDIVYPVDLRPSDLGVVNEDDSTLVMVAAENNKVENLRTMLGTSKSTIDAQHRQTGMTALAMAAKKGYSQCVRVLLRAGARPSIPDMEGYLPLHHAILHNQEDTVEVILDLEFFPKTYIGLFQGRKLCKKSSIHQKIKLAWDRRQEEIVTPELRVCAISGNAESIYCLLEEGDKVDTKSDLSNLPAVFLAVENGQLEVLKLLQEKGASMTQRHPQTGSTVLHLVAKTGDLKIARYLLRFCSSQTSFSSGSVVDHKKGLDINALNNENKTALQIAAEKGFIKFVDILIDYGATVALLNSDGELFSCPEYEGVRIKIHAFRDEHTKQIIKLIIDKSKKAFQQLQKVWLPKFDHNLRDKNGDTPLMVACRHGRLEAVRFLLESAVYKHWMDEESCDDNSEYDDDDADSGVPDMQGQGTIAPPLHPSCSGVSESFLKSLEKSQDLGDLVPEEDTRGNHEVQHEEEEPGNQLQVNSDLDKQSQLNMLLQDVRCPKGCSIYHDGIVSHVCAKNQFDGCTPLHRAVEGGDNSDLVVVLVETDRVCLNMQSDAGLTAVHLACKLGRKRALAKLLEFEDIDINVFTLNGQLPEEMTSNKTVVKMVQKARKGQPIIRPRQKTGAGPESLPSLTDSLGSNRENMLRGSDINFDKVFTRYQTLRQEGKTKAE